MCLYSGPSLCHGCGAEGTCFLSGIHYSCYFCGTHDCISAFWTISRYSSSVVGDTWYYVSVREHDQYSLSPGIACNWRSLYSVSYTHLRAHETRHDLVCRLLLEKKK